MKNQEEIKTAIILGQTLHYIPNMKKMIPLPLTDGFSYKLYEENELSQLCGIKGFENSLAFDEINKEWRGYDLAKLLVRNLTIEILKRDQIPFYSASVTNLASQVVAFGSGYMLLWSILFCTQ